MLQWDGLDHRGHAGERTETERCVTGRGIARQGTFELAAPEYEIHARGLDRLRPDAEDDRDTAGTQALEGRGDRLAAGSRDQNDLGAAERLQSRGGVGRGAVDVVVGAELLRQFRLVGTAGNRRDLEPHVPGVLDTQMAEAADPEHGDKIAGLRRRVSQGAERRESRAQQRRRIDRRQVVRDRHEPARLCDHHFGVPAVMMNAGVFLVPAVHEVAVAAELAVAAGATEKPDTHALTDRPALDTVAKCIDPADDLVSGDARVGDTGKDSIDCRRIRVADATGLNANPDLPRRGRRQLPLHHVQAAGLAHLNGAIGCRCHRQLLRLQRLPLGPGGIAPDGCPGQIGHPILWSPSIGTRWFCARRVLGDGRA